MIDQEDRKVVDARQNRLQVVTLGAALSLLDDTSRKALGRGLLLGDWSPLAKRLLARKLEELLD